MPEDVQVALARMSGEDDIHAVREYLNAVAALDPNKYPLGERGSGIYVTGENLPRRAERGGTPEYGDPSMAPKFYAREGAAICQDSCRIFYNFFSTVCNIAENISPKFGSAGGSPGEGESDTFLTSPSLPNFGRLRDD